MWPMVKVQVGHWSFSHLSASSAMAPANLTSEAAATELAIPVLLQLRDELGTLAQEVRDVKELVRSHQGARLVRHIFSSFSKIRLVFYVCWVCQVPGFGSKLHASCMLGTCQVHAESMPGTCHVCAGSMPSACWDSCPGVCWGHAGYPGDGNAQRPVARVAPCTIDLESI